MGSVDKLRERQTLTFQPLPSISSVESAKIWKTRDQPKPGSLFGKMRDPGNEAGSVSVTNLYSTRKTLENVFKHCLETLRQAQEVWTTCTLFVHTAFVMTDSSYESLHFLVKIPLSVIARF